MATLMTFKSAGGMAGRCDSKCYDAQHDKCECCCAGRNHGAGFVKAFNNTVDHFEAIVKEAGNVRDPKLKVSNIKQNKKFIRYFQELKKQGTLFNKEDEDQLLERIKKRPASRKSDHN